MATASNGNESAIYPMNVLVRSTGLAYNVLRRRRAIPLARAVSAKALAPGLPATKAHDLIYHGGKLIPDLVYRNFYIVGTASWATSDRHNIDHALSAAMSDKGLNNVMVQYFPSGKISSKFAGAKVLPGAKPQLVDATDVKELVRTLYERGEFDSDDLTRTVFNFLLPRGTVLTDGEDGDSETTDQRRDDRDAGRRPLIGGEGHAPGEKQASSLHGLGGYHGSVHIARADGDGTDTVYYAVGVFSEDDNGIAVFDQPWKNVVATFYHELCEARTDPDIDDVIDTGNTKLWSWASRQGEECGDFPVFEADPLTQVFMEIALPNGKGMVPVQLQYSNFVHGPEGPLPTPRPFSKKHSSHVAEVKEMAKALLKPAAKAPMALGIKKSLRRPTRAKAKAAAR